jgi:hypothetical protein
MLVSICLRSLRLEARGALFPLACGIVELMIPFYLKKWYLDLISDDGVVVYLYFISTKIAGMRGGNISAHVALPDGGSLRASMNRRVMLVDSKRSAECAPSFLNNAAGSAHARLELPQLYIDFRYHSSGIPWAPTEGGVLLRKNGNYLAWNVPLPAAAAEGVIQSGRQEWRVSGVGYQDIVEMTLPPWQLPIAELNWGRAHCGHYTVVFDRVKLTHGATLQYVMLRAENTDAGMVASEMFTIETDEGDQKTTLRHDSFALHLSLRHILAEGEIASGEQIKYRLLRKFLAKTSGNPFEKKMVSEAALCLGGHTYGGWAIHERVSWRWKYTERHK